MLREKSGDRIEQAGEYADPSGEKMQVAAPAGGSAKHEGQRKIEKRGRTDAACFSPIKTGMGKQDADAANHEGDKTGGVDPICDADKDRVTRNIQNCRVLDCDRWEVCGLRHYDCGESSTGKCAEQHIRIGVTL